VQVQIKLKQAIDIENIQVKLVSNRRGKNQVDKRSVDKYNEVLNWNMPADVINILKRFTGELLPNITNPRDKKKRRMFIDEFTIDEQEKLFKYLNDNKAMIVNDILRGRGEFAAEWLLVTQKVESNSRWILKNINRPLAKL
jgi:hypothetical protein